MKIIDAQVHLWSQTVEGWADFREWVEAAKQEPEPRITELEYDAEF